MKESTKLKKSNRSYNTKSETEDFGRWLLSDDRKLYYMRRAESMIKQGLKNPIPWSVAVRTLQPDDYKIWKGIKQSEDVKYTQSDILNAYERGVREERARLYKSHE